MDKREGHNAKYLLADVGRLCQVMMLTLSICPVQSVDSSLHLNIYLLFAFVSTVDSVTSKFNVLISQGLEYYKQTHKLKKQTNKNIVVKTKLY